jgi:uncharacterized LabA/DUF88 family protein
LIDISINATSVSPQSTDVLANFIDQTLIRLLKVEAVEYLNKQLIALNKEGKYSLQKLKCNFDVEIATDMRLDHALGKCQTFCLWSGDSDFAHPILQLLNHGRNVVVISKGISTELSELKPDGMIYYDLRKLRELICLSAEKQRGLRQRSPPAKIFWPFDQRQSSKIWRGLSRTKRLTNPNKSTTWSHPA